MEPFVNLFGPVDAVLHSYIRIILLALVFVNMVTRFLAHRHHEAQYEDGGAEAVDRYLPHSLSNVMLVLASFYFTTVHQHGGVVMSMLVVGLFITDFFEFESRKVEARRDLPLDRPKAALGAWSLVLLYGLYLVLFTGPIGQYL